MLETFASLEGFGDGFDAFPRGAIDDAGLMFANQRTQARIFFGIVRDLRNE